MVLQELPKTAISGRKWFDVLIGLTETFDEMI
jgi:hypothetical protein